MSGHSNAPSAVAIAGADPRLYNHDLAPVAPAGRTWGAFSIFAMWMSDVHSVGGYTFAASLFFLGLTGREVLLAMVVGITAVYFLMNLIGRPSLKYGTPFPVVARMSFGVMGANIAAGLRGIVGIVWYGVQTYFASKAVQALVLAFYPGAEAYTHSSFIGLSALGWFSFLFMWLFQLLIFLNGMETIRKFIDFCGPVVYIVMFALAIWILAQTGTSSLSLQLSPRVEGSAVGHMANAAMLIVGHFAALLLNFGDFSRFARNERAMKVGNFLGLPVNFIVFAIITSSPREPSRCSASHGPRRHRRAHRQSLGGGTRLYYLHRRHHGYQHRRQLCLAGLRHFQPVSGEDRLPAGRADHVDPVGDGVPVDFRLEPAGHHHFRQHLRRGARPDVRHHGGGLLFGEAPANHPGRPLHPVAGGLAPFRGWLEPPRADRARGRGLHFDLAVAVWRLRRHSEHWRLGMADRCHAGRCAVHGADAPRSAVVIAAWRRGGVIRRRSGAHRAGRRKAWPDGEPEPGISSFRLSRRAR